MWGCSPGQVIGRPLLEAVPELKGQGFEELIRQVYFTGVPFVGKEIPAQLMRNGKLETSYFNFVFQPLRDGKEVVSGVLNVVIDVTASVLARQQVQALNDELAATNRRNPHN